MARLRALPRDALESTLPEKDKHRIALEWLTDNPDHKTHHAVSIWKIKDTETFRKAWQRKRKRLERQAQNLPALQSGGWNKILDSVQERAIIIYAADHAIDGRRGATKQMLYNCAVFFRRQEGKSAPTWRWFQLWLKDQTELHTIKTKPIASHRVDMHTEANLYEWFHSEYRPALEFCEIGPYDGHRVCNMDEKGCRVCMPAGEEVVVPIGIKEMYTGIPENRLSVTVIEAITAGGKVITPVVIVPGKLIMSSWFSEHMTGYELLTVSDSGYTNDGIMMVWLDHFIYHMEQTPESEWIILLLDGQVCHEATNFVLKAKIYKIWLVEYPSHQTHLLQPLDVGCFREWKHYQQVKIMDAIRSWEPEYTLKSFFRDLPDIRGRTFTKQTIKSSFQKSGMWPVSFKMVKKKLDEYGKKKKRDTGLSFLEYGDIAESDSEEVGRIQPVIDPEPSLPALPLPPQPPTSYADCRDQLESLQDKIAAGLSSPTRAKWTVTKTATAEFLMRGSLTTMDLENSKARQIAFQKSKLSSRHSLQKGGSILASTALQKNKVKEVEVTGKALKKAKDALKVQRNVEKKKLYRLGVADREEERLRVKWLKDRHALERQGIHVIDIPMAKMIPVRDRENAPTAQELEEIEIRLQPWKDTLAIEQAAYDDTVAKDLSKFGPADMLIDPLILEAERAFEVRRNPLARILIDEEDEPESMIPSSPLARIALDVKDGVDAMDLTSSPPRSVASVDSFTGNHDFIALGYQ